MRRLIRVKEIIIDVRGPQSMLRIYKRVSDCLFVGVLMIRMLRIILFLSLINSTRCQNCWLSVLTSPYLGWVYTL